MEIQRKALYNLVRMNWLHDRSTACEPWQVEEYRELNLVQLMARLKKLGLPLDQQIFMAYTVDVDSPEELTDFLLDDADFEPEVQDQIYLHVFELWRRLLPEKMSLSLFCDELDHQIFLYDRGEAASGEAIQDALANLQIILDENVDEGGKPLEVFQSISEACANDLESFLYDFISEQVDGGNFSYAFELLEGFANYLKGSKWFELLNIRVQMNSDPEIAREELRKLLLKAAKEEDLEFNFELLATLSQYGDKGEFNKIIRKTVPLLEIEEDFQEVLQLCGDFYRCLDEDQKEQSVLEVLAKRAGVKPGAPLKKNDPDLSELLKVIR